jgi:hypothetical protein
MHFIDNNNNGKVRSIKRLNAGCNSASENRSDQEMVTMARRTRPKPKGNS